MSIFHVKYITYCNIYCDCNAGHPFITTATPSVVNARVGATLTLSCTSEGSPPDTFTWMKDGVLLMQSTAVVTVTHTDEIAVFRSDYTINKITTNDNGTYTCTVTNPFGSDTHSIDLIPGNITGELEFVVIVIRNKSLSCRLELFFHCMVNTLFPILKLLDMSDRLSDCLMFAKY